MVTPQVCEQLQAELAAKRAELDTSKATILSLLEGGGVPKLDAPAEHAAPDFLGAATSGRPTDLFVRALATTRRLNPPWPPASLPPLPPVN